MTKTIMIDSPKLARGRTRIREACGPKLGGIINRVLCDPNVLAHMEARIEDGDSPLTAISHALLFGNNVTVLATPIRQTIGQYVMDLLSLHGYEPCGIARFPHDSIFVTGSRYQKREHVGLDTRIIDAFLSGLTDDERCYVRSRV